MSEAMQGAKRDGVQQQGEGSRKRVKDDIPEISGREALTSPFSTHNNVPITKEQLLGGTVTPSTQHGEGFPIKEELVQDRCAGPSVHPGDDVVATSFRSICTCKQHDPGHSYDNPQYRMRYETLTYRRNQCVRCKVLCELDYDGSIDGSVVLCPTCREERWSRYKHYKRVDTKTPLGAANQLWLRVKFQLDFGYIQKLEVVSGHRWLCDGVVDSGHQDYM
jgi:hypothetical protein